MQRNGPLPTSEKRQEVISERDKQNTVKKDNKENNQSTSFNENEVKIVDKSYLTKAFKATNQITQNNIDSTVKQFTLNEEQEL